MNVNQARLLKQSDPAELGHRLRAVRVARAMTQADVAGDGISVAYVSRMESGQRRPTVKALNHLALKLGVPVEHLLGVATAAEADEVKLLLDYAELSLESGSPQEAVTRLGEVLARVDSCQIEGLSLRAKFLQARAYEALGRADEAIGGLENLLGPHVTGLMRINVGTALSRIYRECGDLSRAVSTGEVILAELEESGLDSCDEAVQLAVTVAAAHFERGDVALAVRICDTAITKADAIGSSRARASAYWNASAMQARRGQISDAVPLAERALALLSDGSDARNLGRLRTELGRLQLALDPPALEEAQQNLERAAEELAWSSASPVDRVWTHLGLAQARLLRGDLVGSRELTTTVQFLSEGSAPLAEAEAKTIEGQSHAAEGDLKEAARSYRQAVLLLSAAGADRGAAQLWFDLADLLDQVGMRDEARDAYKRAAVSTGLRARTRAPAHTLV
jgi:tetratricopeptide (TPR) repeat protein